MCPFCLRMPWKLFPKIVGIHPFKNQLDIQNVHTTTIRNSSRQAGNAMRKILGVDKRRKYIHFEGVPAIKPESFSKGSTEGRPSVNSRRATVLNKLFMKHITDLMVTGEKYIHFEGVPAIKPESFSKGSTEGRPSVNSRRATVLNKLFMKHITDLMVTGEKYIHFEGVPAIKPESFSKGSTEGRPSVNSRRATVLNKLFMKHITDLMVTGEYASEILGHGIEINRVKIAPDYKCLNVYWVARASEDDSAIDDILHKNSGFLRHELSELRVMGNVPKIQFVKDKHYARIVMLDNRLAVADYGEDYVPADDSSQLKAQFELYAPLEDELKKRIAELDADNPVHESDELPFPAMPQNVMGLDHAAILNRIKTQAKKSEALHRQANPTDEADESWASFKMNQPTNDDPVLMGSSKAQREAFREFLHKRQVLRMKARREQKNYTPDLEYVREELRNAQLNRLKKFDDYIDQDDDYILEDESESR